MITIVQTVGYKIGVWHYIDLYLNVEKFNVYFSLNNIHDNLTKLFENDIVDSDLKLGLVGLSTYKTNAYFSEIQLNPLDDSDKKDELLYVDEEQLDLPAKSVSNSILRKYKNLGHFSWMKCLIYPIKEDRLRFCDVLYHSEDLLKQCKENFCESCCHTEVDQTNIINKYMCVKQCRVMEKGNLKNKNWESCINPITPENSVYPYCEKIFKADFYKRNQCKFDLCNLCCISFDAFGRANLNSFTVDKCHKSCENTFNKLP